MDTIRLVTTPSPAVVAIRPVSPAAVIGDREAQVLDPAVSLDVGGGSAIASSSEQRGYERDAVSQSLVFRVTDALSGDVIVQIPDEIVLKARAYARQDNGPVGEQVEASA